MQQLLTKTHMDNLFVCSTDSICLLWHYTGCKKPFMCLLQLRTWNVYMTKLRVWVSCANGMQKILDNKKPSRNHNSTIHFGLYASHSHPSLVSTHTYNIKHIVRTILFDEIYLFTFIFDDCDDSVRLFTAHFFFVTLFNFLFSHIC